MKQISELEMKKRHEAFSPFLFLPWNVSVSCTGSVAERTWTQGVSMPGGQ